jgi:Protein of unknown function (DUF3048) C-terminal domain
MRWSWRNIMIGTSAAVAAIGLAVALVVVLAGRGVPPAAPTPSPGRSSQLYSPFTGEPMTSLGPVLAVKIDNLAPARPQTGLAGAGTGLVLRGGKAYTVRWSRSDADGGTTFTTMSGQVMTFAHGPVWVVLAAAP